MLKYKVLFISVSLLATATIFSCAKAKITPTNSVITKDSTNATNGIKYTVTVPAGTKDCFIAGDMNGWVPHEMEKISESIYSLTIPEATTAQHYKYCSGPLLVNYIEKAATGGDTPNRNYQSADVVQNWGSVWDPAIPAIINVGSGNAKSYFFRSKIVDSRSIEVWLPFGYDRSKKYAVLYMHDGQALFDSTTNWNRQEWQIDEVMGNLLGKGTIQNTIVIGINNNGIKREAEFFPQASVANIPDPEKTQLMNLMPGGPIADNYLRFIVTELKPYIDKIYSTYTDQQHTFMGGSSLGGMITLYALCKYPDVFSRGFCMSTHWVGTFSQNVAVPTAVINYLSTSLPSPSNHKFYFDHGTMGLDSMYAAAQKRVDSLMQAKGYTNLNFKSLVIEGATHQEKDWAKRLAVPLMFLLKP
jgi:enterochelin esterase-like enzyme